MDCQWEGDRQILEGESKVRGRESDSGREFSGERERDRFWKGSVRLEGKRKILEGNSQVRGREIDSGRRK